MAAGTLAVAVVLPVMDTGPDHKYAVTLEGLLATRFNVTPAHIGPLLEAPESEGAAFTVIAAVDIHPVPSV